MQYWSVRVLGVGVCLIRGFSLPTVTLMTACMRMDKSGCGQDICLEVHYNNSLVNLHACSM